MEKGWKVVSIRILVFNWRDILNPEAGGAEIHLHEIFKRIVQEGHEVTVISSKYDGCECYKEVDGVKIHRVGGKFLYGVTAPLYYVFKLRGNGFDVVIDDISKVPLFTPLYVKEPLVAIIHHFHGPTFFKELPLPLALILYLLEKLIPLIYRRTPFTTVSDSTKTELVSHHLLKEQVAVIHNGINSHFSTGEKAGNPLVAYVGRVKRYKQIDHLVRAFKKVKEKVPDAELIVAGKGDAHEEILRLARKLGVAITCLKEVSEEEKVSILQRAWVFVATSMKEGWGISVIEANACGTPVIAYNTPGLKDAVKDGETGYLVPYGDIEKLASKIVEILTNHKLRRKMEQKAVKWARRFSWDASAEKMLKTIEKVVSHNHTHGHELHDSPKQAPIRNTKKTIPYM